MRKIIQAVKKIPDNLFEGEVDVLTWFFGFSGIMAVRELIKSLLATSGFSMIEVVTDYTHELLFFAITFLLVWFFLSFILKIGVSRLSKAFFWAAWIVVFPPVIDMLKTGGSVFWSFYLLGTPAELWLEFASIFGNFPSGIVYFGTKIMILLVVVLAGFMAYWQSKKVLTGLVASVGTYIIFFFMAAFPALLAFLVKGTAQISAVDQIQLFGGAPQIFGIVFDGMRYSLAFNLNLIMYPWLFGLLGVFLWLLNSSRFVAVFRNLRFPQIIYHFGLFSVGMGLGALEYPDNLDINLFSLSSAIVLLIGIFSAWEASVIANDVVDLQTDKITNTERPLPKAIFDEKSYARLGYAFFAFSLLGGLVVGLKFMAMLFLYQFLAWAYSVPPYRLKRFPVVATLLSAAASILVLFMGFLLLSGDNNLAGLSWRIIWLLLISLTLSLPIKDFKDITGDKKEEVWTIPVIFGEEKGRLIVAVGIFISFMLSVFLLNEFRLFWWAILFGGLAFWFVTTKKPRQLFWWVGSVVFVYGIILVKVLFL